MVRGIPTSLSLAVAKGKAAIDAPTFEHVHKAQSSGVLSSSVLDSFPS
jgi:hypothetical protein